MLEVHPTPEVMTLKQIAYDKYHQVPYFCVLTDIMIIILYTIRKSEEAHACAVMALWGEVPQVPFFSEQ